MQENIFTRTEQLIGTENLAKLKTAKVAVFGIGGVGSFVAEGLVRAGIGNIVLIDNDVISITNINRQIHATTKTIGKLKTEVMKQRLLEINPDLKIETYQPNKLDKPEEQLIDKTYTYIVDAVDTITTKLKLIQKAKEQNIPIISCMGTGNKLDPTKFEITDISQTSVCPLAKIIRKELKTQGIQNVKVLYSKEEPIKPHTNPNQKPTPSSISYVPSTAGLLIAAQVTQDILTP